ncbi:mas-related G-protein coupled receptor member H-like [Centropristis striata]|uniref:mas-related G-protein coupled receptor member H-like n=1 Tax=Centropristis striata TaxID=184440 RepID=UPI0027E000CB|nr:mas-related G-protein coupled receptor member H-like [Centropristis striata]
MDNTSQVNGLNDTTGNCTDYYRNNFDSSNFFCFVSFSGLPSSGEVAIIQFVETCLLICLGLPLTLWAIYGLFSQMNGEVAPIYVINLLISDLIQYSCLIVEVAQLKNINPVYNKIFTVFNYIYHYGLEVSVCFMVVIALERYLVIVHPLWYRFRRTIKTSVLICVLVWIPPVVISLIQYFYPNNIAVAVLPSIFYILPLPLLIFFLTATLRALYATISVPTDEKTRIAGMLILVLLIYTLLFLPAIVMYVIRYDSIYNPTQYMNPHLTLLSKLTPLSLKLSPLADLVLYMLMRKGTIRQLSACVCRWKTCSNKISTVTVNMSAMRDEKSSPGKRRRELKGGDHEGDLGQLFSVLEGKK